MFSKPFPKNLRFSNNGWGKIKLHIKEMTRQKFDYFGSLKHTFQESTFMNRLALRPRVILKSLFMISAAGTALITVFILVFMLFGGFPLIKNGGFLQTVTGQWLPQKNQFGIYPMIRASVVLTVTAVLIAFPLSFSTSAISVFGSNNVLGLLIRRWTAIMTGIPTVIYGFLGVVLIVPFFRMMNAGTSGYSLIAASSVLAIMISPTMILILTAYFEKKTLKYRKTALSLGADDFQLFLGVTVPASGKGMLTALVLGAGRAAGDTMIALMMAGNSAATDFSLIAPARTLTSHIALIMNADFESLAFRSVFVCGAALYGFTGLCAVTVRMMTSED